MQTPPPPPPHTQHADTFLHTNFYTNSYNDALAIPIKTNAKNNFPQQSCSNFTLRNKFTRKIFEYLLP